MHSGVARLLVHVEGYTEEYFVKEVLEPHLLNFGYSTARPTLIGMARKRERRGGIKDWTSVKRRIRNHLVEQSNLVVSTMVDYYGLKPRVGDNAWPGYQPENLNLTSRARAEIIHQLMCADIDQQLSGYNLQNRFIPYVAMHEFEGLLFSDCEKIISVTNKPDKLQALIDIRNQFQSPEDINDNINTAPSKRLEALFGKGFKTLHSGNVAKAIGVDGIRAVCPVFDDWVSQLEQWPANHL